MNIHQIYTAVENKNNNYYYISQVMQFKATMFKIIIYCQTN